MLYHQIRLGKKPLYGVLDFTPVRLRQPRAGDEQNVPSRADR